MPKSRQFVDVAFQMFFATFEELFRVAHAEGWFLSFSLWDHSLHIAVWLWIRDFHIMGMPTTSKDLGMPTTSKDLGMPTTKKGLGHAHYKQGLGHAHYKQKDLGMPTTSKRTWACVVPVVVIFSDVKQRPRI